MTGPFGIIGRRCRWPHGDTPRRDDEARNLDQRSENLPAETQQFGHPAALGARKGGAMTNEAAFSAYVAARRPQLFRTACLLCGDPHRAEDVVQDALVRLYGAWDRVSRIDNIDGYVRRIIVNADYSDRRRPWRRERATEPRDVPLDPGFPVEDADAIRAALRALPPGQRRVIVLRHIWNLTIEETAAELRISTGTVKSQSADAVAALRKSLAPAFGTALGKAEDR
jgi:RNA polymerase sigma-70 factor (sigma-E family)